MGEGSHIYGGGGGGRGSSGNGARKAPASKSRIFQEDRRKRAAERYRQKSDIDGRYTSGEARTLGAEAAKIRNGKVENARIVNADGSLAYSARGGKHSVKMPFVYRNNRVAMHNHPNDQYANKISIAARIGQSFSGADIANAMLSNQKGTRVVTSGYTFNIDGTQGKQNVRPSNVKSFYTRTLNAQRKKDMAYIAAGKSAEDINRRNERSWTMANHKAAEATAKKYGLRYTRKKN